MNDEADKQAHAVKYELEQHGWTAHLQSTAYPPEYFEATPREMKLPAHVEHTLTASRGTSHVIAFWSAWAELGAVPEHMHFETAIVNHGTRTETFRTVDGLLAHIRLHEPPQPQREVYVVITQHEPWDDPEVAVLDHEPDWPKPEGVQQVVWRARINGGDAERLGTWPAGGPKCTRCDRYACTCDKPPSALTDVEKPPEHSHLDITLAYTALLYRGALANLTVEQGQQLRAELLEDYYAQTEHRNLYTYSGVWLEARRGA